VWKPNLQVKTLTIDGKKVKVKLSTNALRSLKKKGVI
jgi:large subunit ribosomal protein L28